MSPSRKTRSGGCRRGFAAGSGRIARGCPRPCRRRRGARSGNGHTGRNAPGEEAQRQSRATISPEWSFQRAALGTVRASVLPPADAPGMQALAGVAARPVSEGAAAPEAVADERAVDLGHRSGGSASLPASAPRGPAGSCTDRARSRRTGSSEKGRAESSGRAMITSPGRGPSACPPLARMRAAGQLMQAGEKVVRGISRPPSETRCSVRIWQSIMPKSCA